MLLYLGIVVITVILIYMLYISMLLLLSDMKIKLAKRNLNATFSYARDHFSVLRIFPPHIAIIWLCTPWKPPEPGTGPSFLCA